MFRRESEAFQFLPVVNFLKRRIYCFMSTSTYVVESVSDKHIKKTKIFFRNLPYQILLYYI